MRELFSLKQLFGVSAQAIAFRCCGSRHHQRLAKKQIFIEFGKRGWRKAEPNSELIPKEHPARFRTTVPPSAIRRCNLAVEGSRASGCRLSRATCKLGSTTLSVARMARLLVSDTSVLIDLERGNLLQTTFKLPTPLAVPMCCTKENCGTQWRTAAYARPPDSEAG